MQQVRVKRKFLRFRSVKSVFYLLDTAPYGSEKAFGALNAAVVSLNGMHVTLGLYEDGVYLAVAGQDSKKLGVPNLADILYAYGELRVIAHEPSLVERGLFGETLIETLELTDEEDFFEAMENSDCVILL
jgi:tRNA 2-thiouridine synthesizing protein C